jgi:hypothetical protein
MKSSMPQGAQAPGKRRELLGAVTVESEDPGGKQSPTGTLRVLLDARH